MRLTEIFLYMEDNRFQVEITWLRAHLWFIWTDWYFSCSFYSNNQYRLKWSGDVIPLKFWEVLKLRPPNLCSVRDGGGEHIDANETAHRHNRRYGPKVQTNRHALVFAVMGYCCTQRIIYYFFPFSRSPTKICMRLCFNASFPHSIFLSFFLSLSLHNSCTEKYIWVYWSLSTAGRIGKSSIMYVEAANYGPCSPCVFAQLLTAQGHFMAFIWHELCKPSSCKYKWLRYRRRSRCEHALTVPLLSI